ncbi:hypothetical protein GCM10010443_93190 [Actinoplanes cyaneus]
METLIFVAAALGALYVMAGAADLVLGQPRTSSGNFASNRTTVIEDGVKIGCLIALLITVLFIL